MHKLKKEYAEAIEGEGWAITDYKDLLSKVKTEKEKKVISHIMKEEQEHLKELMDILHCK